MDDNNSGSRNDAGTINHLSKLLNKAYGKLSGDDNTSAAVSSDKNEEYAIKNISVNNDKDDYNKGEPLIEHSEIKTDVVDTSTSGLKTSQGNIIQKCTDTIKSNKNVADSLKPKLPRIIYGASIFINILALGLPLTILQVYDRIVPNNAINTLNLLFSGLVIVLVFDIIMKVARSYLVGWTTTRSHYQTSTEAVARVLNTPSEQVSRETVSSHIERINALESLREYFGGQTRLLLLDLPFVVVFMGLILAIGGIVLFLVPFTLFLIIGAFTIYSSRRLKDIMEERSQHDERRYDFIIEVLQGIQVVKMMAMEPQMQRRYERLQKTGSKASYDVIMIGNVIQMLSMLFSNMTMVLVVSVGAIMAIYNNLSIGALACCTLLAGRAIQPLVKGFSLWTQVQTINISKERVNKLFEETIPVSDNSAPIRKLRGGVSIKNVEVIGEDGNTIVDDLSLNISPGSILGIRGADGSGKTTILKLIKGDIIPKSGVVEIDGKDVNGDEKDSLAEWVSYTPQKATVFNGTILENISMFKTGGAIDDAVQAAKLIGLESDINRLPDGYDTVLSEGITEELPVGVIQRITIARAIAMRPKILLFDEANASLDMQSDRLLREAFKQLRGKVTMVLVSQRSSLLNIADKVFEFKDGKMEAVNLKASTSDIDKASDSKSPTDQISA